MPSLTPEGWTRRSSQPDGFVWHSHHRDLRGMVFLTFAFAVACGVAGYHIGRVAEPSKQGEATAPFAQTVPDQLPVPEAAVRSQEQQAAARTQQPAVVLLNSGAGAVDHARPDPEQEKPSDRGKISTKAQDNLRAKQRVPRDTSQWLRTYGELREYTLRGR